jgi:hypothetical protein
LKTPPGRGRTPPPQPDRPSIDPSSPSRRNRMWASD